MFSPDAARGILPLRARNGGVVFMGLKNEPSVSHTDIFLSISIDLKFVVAPTKGIFFDTPFGVIQFFAREFV